MLWVEQFQWTSRAAVCAQLIEFLNDTPPSPPLEDQPLPLTAPDRMAAVDLLARLADDTAIPGLRRILLNRNEERWVRIFALRGLSRFEEVLSLPELVELLIDRRFWHGSRSEEPFVLSELLEFFRSPEARQVARAFVESWTAAERTRLLASILDRQFEDTNPDLLNDFYGQWLSVDRSLLEGAAGQDWLLNLDVVTKTKDRPESRALLLRYWREGDEEQRHALLTDWWENDELIAEAAKGVDGDEHQLATALRLPESALWEQLGPDQLVLLIEEKIRTANRVLRADQHYMIESWWDEASRAFQLLLDWPSAEMNERITSMLCCPDLDQRLRGDLLHLLRKRDPRRAAAVMRLAMTDSSFIPLFRRILTQTPPHTLSEDRDLLRWGVKQEIDAVVRYHAVYALETLGEDTPDWRQRLNALTWDADPYLALHAAAALVRRGHGSLLPRIEEGARNAEHVCVRAEAVRILGELDAERFLPFLHRSLLEDHEACGLCPYDYPVFEEAAPALARVGTPQALTALIQSYLIAPGLGGRGPLHNYLSWLLEPSDWDGEERYFLDPGRWQRCRLEKAAGRWDSPLRCYDW
jgi:HEAT repeat protein